MTIVRHTKSADMAVVRQRGRRKRWRLEAEGPLIFSSSGSAGAVGQTWQYNAVLRKMKCAG